MNSNRTNRITHASILGIVLNVVLAGLKAIIGVISGSVSVLTDAINNFTDTFSAIVTLIGTRLAQKKPDKEHPYGHGRIEYIAAILVGLIIFGVGVGAVLTSVPLILEPKLANYSIVSIVVIFTTVIAKFLYSRHAKKIGKEEKSRSLSATGTDAMFDALLSLGTLVGAGVSLVFGVSIDGYIGVLISAFIIRSAIEILTEGVVDIIGRRVDEKLARSIKERIREHEEVKGISKLVLHDYGPVEMSGAVKLEVSPKMEIREFAKLSREIEAEIKEEFNVRLTIGVE